MVLAMEDKHGKQEVLLLVKELRETSDIKEVAEMLSSGNWIAISATTREPIKFCMGRVNQASHPTDGQENT